MSLLWIQECYLSFLVLPLYPATLLNLLINSSSLLIEVLGSSMQSIISSANSDNLTSSFPILILLISLSCLIALDNDSRVILNKSGESSEHPCFNFRVKAFSCCLFSIMLSVSCSQMAFIRLRQIPCSSSFYKVFIMNKCCTLSQTFSASLR